MKLFRRGKLFLKVIKSGCICEPWSSGGVRYCGREKGEVLEYEEVKTGLICDGKNIGKVKAVVKVHGELI